MKDNIKVGDRLEYGHSKAKMVVEAIQLYKSPISGKFETAILMRVGGDVLTHFDLDILNLDLQCGVIQFCTEDKIASLEAQIARLKEQEYELNNELEYNHRMLNGAISRLGEVSCLQTILKINDELDEINFELVYAQKELKELKHG